MVLDWRIPQHFQKNPLLQKTKGPTRKGGGQNSGPRLRAPPRRTSYVAAGPGTRERAGFARPYERAYICDPGRRQPAAPTRLRYLVAIERPSYHPDNGGDPPDALHTRHRRVRIRKRQRGGSHIEFLVRAVDVCVDGEIRNCCSACTLL